MTAHALKGDEDRCLDSGMAADISKPIRSSQLYEIPERMLDAREAKGRAPVAAPEKPLRCLCTWPLGLNETERFVGGAELRCVFIEDDGDWNIL